MRPRAAATPALPSDRNPRTLAFSAELRRSHPDDLGYVQAVLDLFRREEFFYTLSPPPARR